VVRKPVSPPRNTIGSGVDEWMPPILLTEAKGLIRALLFMVRSPTSRPPHVTASRSGAPSPKRATCTATLGPRRVPKTTLPQLTRRNQQRPTRGAGHAGTRGSRRPVAGRGGGLWTTGVGKGAGGVVPTPGIGFARGQAPWRGGARPRWVGGFGRWCCGGAGLRPSRLLLGRAAPRRAPPPAPDAGDVRTRVPPQAPSRPRRGHRTPAPPQAPSRPQHGRPLGAVPPPRRGTAPARVRPGAVEARPRACGGRPELASSPPPLAAARPSPAARSSPRRAPARGGGGGRGRVAGSLADG
jgi:hypothetical protein